MSDVLVESGCGENEELVPARPVSAVADLLCKKLDSDDIDRQAPQH